MYKFKQARPNTECQAGFRKKYLPFKHFQSEAQAPRDQPKTKKTKKIDHKLEQPLRLYELFLKSLYGIEFTEDDFMYYELLIGKCSHDVNKEFYPDGVLSFPNPDHEEIIKPLEMQPLEFFDFVQQALKINSKSFQDQLLFKAIETTYQGLLVSKTKAVQSQASQDPFQLQSQVSEVKYKQFITQQTFTDRAGLSKSMRLPQSPAEKIDQAVKALREKFEQALSSNMRANLIDYINLDYKKLEEMQARSTVLGEYLNQFSEQWTKTKKETLDTTTLLRNAVLIQLARRGFQTKQVLSNDGKWIFLLLKMSEENLKIVAEHKKLSKRLNFWFSDLLSLEPVDKRLRPLRLNNRLWKSSEYQCSSFFLYLKPQIIELINTINFKRISREVNQSHINPQLFSYGKQDLYDEQDLGPTDDQWFAYYKYLVHLEKCILELRQQDGLDSDISAILNKQMDSFQVYVKRNFQELVNLGLANKNEVLLNKQNIMNPENHQHLITVLKYDKDSTNLVDEYKQYMIEQKIPVTKYVKILQRERLAYRYMNAFIEAFQVANANKIYLKNLWDQVGLLPQEPYFRFRKPTKNMAPTLQAQQMMLWCKYQKDEDGNISVFNSTDILKLVFLAVGDCFDVNSFTTKGYMHSFFSLNDQYELLGFCQDVESVLTKETQFFQKKMFSLIDEWHFRILDPWYVPSDIICAYYGEKIALYFYFMSYFTKMLTFISLCGFGCSLAEWILNDEDGEPNILTSMVFSFILIQWTNIATDYWKQQQVIFNIKYGQTNEKEKSTERSSFKGTYNRSLENDQMNAVAQDDSDLVFRLMLASGLLAALIAAYSGLFIGLFALTTSLKQNFQNSFQSVSIMYLEVTLSATINVFIQLFVDKLYDTISTSLTDFENHKTMEKYETSFVVKKFILYFCSYVVPLLFIGYLNQPLNLYCSKSNCSKHVQYYFSTVIIWQFLFKILLLFKFVTDLKKYPAIKYELNDQDILQYIDDTNRRQSYAISPERYGTLEDFMEVFILFALLVVFGYSFPLSFFLLWLFNILQLQVKKYQFVYCLQRPWPQTESSLGIWNKIMESINQLGILTNTGVITILYNKKYGEQLILVFLSLLISNSLCKFVITAVFGDTPFRLTQLMLRHKYLLKSTLEVFSKSKQKSAIKKDEEDNYKRFPIFKLFNSTNEAVNGSFQSLSSQSDLEEHMTKQKGFKELRNQVTLANFKKQPIKVDPDDPPFEIVQKHFTTRVSNWALEIQYNNLTSFQKKKKLFKYWKYLYKLQLLTNYRKLWTEDRINLRHIIIKRKKLALKNLDQRKLIILKQNFALIHQLYQDQASLKFRKQFQKLNKNSTKPDDIKEYENMVEKQQKYIDKQTWINCRKVVVLKFKAIWIKGFRKSISRRSALLNVKAIYKKSQLGDNLTLKSAIHKQYNKLIENNQKMDGYGMKEFINMLSQLTFEQSEAVRFPLTSQSINNQQYLLHPKKSYIFKTVIDQLRDTFIFDYQVSKLQEIAMQFFIEEQFQIENIELIKHFHDHTWLGRQDNKEYLVQFLQVPFGVKAQFQHRLDSKYGVYYAQSKNYLRLSNIIDQIDDFIIKGYCLCLYDLEKPLSLWQVIKFRQTYGIDYTIEEINQFLYANLVLLKQRPHSNISIYNYFLDGRQYALLNSLKKEPPISSLAKVIISMITLKLIEDPYDQLEQMKHNYTDMLRAMLDQSITIEQIIFEIKKQSRFKEMQYAQDIFKQPDQNFHAQIQLYLHKINCSYRMKFYDQALFFVNQFENILKREYPPLNETSIQIFSRSLKTDITKAILQPNKMQQNLDIILIFYFHIATLCSMKMEFDEELKHLLNGITGCTNEINLIIRQLCLNIEFQNLQPSEQYVLLRKRKRNKSTTQLFSQERMILLEALRVNKEYIDTIQQYKQQLQRYYNQLNLIQAIKQYINGNYGFASFLIDDSLKNTEKIIKPIPLPKILEEARAMSLELFNLDQFSPQMDEDENIDLYNKHIHYFNLVEEINFNTNYCTQYLYQKYLQLIVWYDERNGMFDSYAQQFINYPIQNIAAYDNMKYQIIQLMRLEVSQTYIESLDQCELGKYLVLKIRKWNETNFNEITDIVDEDDFQYMWVQLMTLSLINKSLTNRQILIEILEQSKDDIRSLLLKIRILHQLLHMDNYSPTNLIINPFPIDDSKLNKTYEEKSKILYLKKLTKQFKYLYYYLEESWYQHPSLNQLRITYLLSTCFAFSPKHAENILNQSQLEIQELQNALNQILENKSPECYNLMLKAAQIVLLHDYCNLLDDEATGFVKYQQIHTFMTLSLQQGVGLQATFEAIKRVIKYDISPSIFILSLIQQLVSFSLPDLADVFIRLVQKLIQCKSVILEDAHEGFGLDLKIFTFFTRSPDMIIIKPYDQLYIRYPAISQYQNLLLDSQSMLYFSLYHPNVEEQQVQIKGYLRQLILDKTYTRIIQVYESLLLYMNMQIGEEIDQLQSKVTRYQVTEKTLFHAIISHQLSRYYACRYDYQQAYNHSLAVLNYIYSAQFEEAIILRFKKTQLVFENNLQNSNIMNLFNLSLFECIPEEADQYYNNILDETFINEQILVHVESVINLQQHYMYQMEFHQRKSRSATFYQKQQQEKKEKSWQKIFDIQLQFTHLLYLLRSLPFRTQQLQMYYIIAQYLLNHLSISGIQELELCIKKGYKNRLKEIRNEIKLIKSTISQKILQKELTPEEYTEAEIRKSILSFEESIMGSAEYSLNKTIALSWIHQAIERALEICEQIQEQYLIKMHFLVPKLQILQIQMYQENEQLIRALSQVTVVEDTLRNFYSNNSHPTKGVLYYLKGKQRQWYIEQVIEFQAFNQGELRIIIKGLLDQTQELYALWDKFDSPYRQQIQEKLEEFIIQQIGHSAKDPQLPTDLKVSEATVLVEDMIKQFQTQVDFNGNMDFIYAQGQFDYFQQDNFYTQDIIYIAQQDRQLNKQQELELQAQQKKQTKKK